MNGLRFGAIHAQNVAGETISGWNPKEERVKACVFEILESNTLCTIGTVTPDGHPHVNTAYFSYSDALELYFLSHPNSLHCRNVSSNPSTAVTVYSSAQQWTSPGRGVQLFGVCEKASGSSAEDAERSYQSRFKAYMTWKAALRDEDLAHQYRFYRFTVNQVKILDEKYLGDAVWVVASVVRS